MVHSQIQNRVTSTTPHVRPLKLTTGQIFQGQITKLYPNNFAALSMNGMKITARLEAALTAGQRYWFEVKEGSGIPRVRVLSDNVASGQKGLPPQAITEQLIHLLHIPKSKGLETLVQQLTEKQIPFTRQTLLTGIHLLEQLNQFSAKGVQTLLQMMQRQLPLTTETFHAYRAIDEEPSISNQLQKLANQLTNSTHPVAGQVNELITKILMPHAFQLNESPLKQLLLNFSSQLGMDLGQGAKQLLTRLGVIHEGVNHTQVYEEFQRAVLNPSNRELVTALWPQLNSGRGLDQAQDVKTFFETMVAGLSIRAGKEGVVQLQQLLTLLQSNNTANRVLEQWIELPSQPLSSVEKVALQQAIEIAATMKNPHGTAGTHVQSILQMLGIQHEHDVIRFLQGDLTKEALHSERLKALLLQLQAQELAQPLKEQVTKTINRLTGQQILSHEQAGHHQWIIQIPLSLGSFSTDMTVQWEGKKKSDGELDPDFCRILFYVTLERLEETVIDVQIQNRYMAVSVYNEQKRPAMLELLIPSLRDSLLKQNYQLLSVKWEKMKDANTPKTIDYHSNVSYQGVDVRI